MTKQKAVKEQGLRARRVLFSKIARIVDDVALQSVQSNQPEIWSGEFARMLGIHQVEELTVLVRELGEQMRALDEIKQRRWNTRANIMDLIEYRPLQKAEAENTIR